jgi:hypothetical protein
MAAAKKIPHTEFARVINTELPQQLAGRPGCVKVLTALAKVRGNTLDMGEMVAELVAIEPEIRAAIADVKEYAPELARGLSKLADVPACADFLTEDEMLEKLEFLRARI